MKYAHAYGTLKHHVEMVIAVSEADFPDDTLEQYIKRMAKAYKELLNEDGTLKEINEGNNNE